MFVVGYGGQMFWFVLFEDQVFEDCILCLVDLDGDGRLEIIIICFYWIVGGSVVVFGFEKGVIEELFVFCLIGWVNCWLNIVGIEDYVGFGWL